MLVWLLLLLLVSHGGRGQDRTGQGRLRLRLRLRQESLAAPCSLFSDMCVCVILCRPLLRYYSTGPCLLGGSADARSVSPRPGPGPEGTEAQAPPYLEIQGEAAHRLPEKSSESGDMQGDAAEGTT